MDDPHQRAQIALSMVRGHLAGDGVAITRCEAAQWLELYVEYASAHIRCSHAMLRIVDGMWP